MVTAGSTDETHVLKAQFSCNALTQYNVPSNRMAMPHTCLWFVPVSLRHCMVSTYSTCIMASVHAISVVTQYEPNFSSSTYQPLTTKQVILAASDSPARSLVPKLLCGAEPDTLFEHAQFPQEFWELETSGYYNNIPCIIIASFPGPFPLPVLYANTDQRRPEIKYMYHVSDINHGHQGQ